MSKGGLGRCLGVVDGGGSVSVGGGFSLALGLPPWPDARLDV